MRILSDEDLAKLENAQNEVISRSDDIPLGYTAIELSTKGKLGAPKIFHIRNFKTGDLIDLSLTSRDDLPESVVKMIDGMIFEKAVSIKNFHEKEVIELLVRLFMIYFAPNIDVDFDVLDEDLDYLKDKIPYEDYIETLKDLDTKKWKPQTNIDLTKIKTYDLDEKFSPIVTIASKRTGEKFKFSFPKFGDILIVKKFLKLKFEKEEKQFASLRRMISFQEEMENKFRNGEMIDLNKVPNVPESEMQRLHEFDIEKAVYAMDLIRAVQIIGYNGKDLSKMSLIEKLEVLDTTVLDHNINTKLEKYYSSLKFGINDMIDMYNPIKKITESRRFSFRLMDILQAVKSFDSDELDIIVGD